MNRRIRWVGLAAMTLAIPILGRAQDPAMSAPSQNEQPRTQATQDASSAIASWPANTKATARHLIDKYGPPDAATDTRLVWNDHGKWSQIRLFREGVSNDFPTTHKDIVENTILYDVPADKAGELTKFYPGLSVDRLSGTLSARSDSEETNTLALNLADEIVRGKRDVDSARNDMRRIRRESMSGKSSRYTDHLLFPVADRGPVNGGR